MAQLHCQPFRDIPHLHVWDINITSRQSGIRVGVIFEDETLQYQNGCYISSNHLITYVVLTTQL